MLGQRLKEARIEAGLSQRQLCGEVITRNMLSQIESGKARPSMQTLQYLAQMLQKPVSWFLDELPEQPPADPAPEQARKLYAEGKYQQCLEQLDACQKDTNGAEAELWLIRALCRLSLAREAIEEGKYHYARSLLERVTLAGKHTPYYTPQLERERLLLLYQCAPEQAGELAKHLSEDDRELLLRAQSALSAGDFSGAATLLQAARKQDSRWHYLFGQAALGQAQYREATEHFLRAEADYPLACAKALETCYRELEDYKMAYQYACKQRQV
ncbi:MAG: helix-turn-helix domain-containing protein [Oscillospiraceae bacterium]|nr:helix-turn-helix domain-containing protein [Oscillospiraceae bacterium]